jgi:hypothetical protein
MIEIEAPDGTVVEFPEGTDDATITRAMQQAFGGPAAEDVKAIPQDSASIAVDSILFGLPTKAVAGANALIRAPFTDKTIGEEYDTLYQGMRKGQQEYRDANPVKATAAQLVGSVYGGGAAAKAALTGAKAVAPSVVSKMGQSFAGKVAGDAALGTGIGAASAYGNDQDIGTGALIGGVTGGLARPAVAAGGAAIKYVAGLLGVGNSQRAQTALAEALARSGKTADDVVDEIAAAQKAGQPYTVADALGNPGQRMLSGVVRSPGDARGRIVDTLRTRQSGQADRLSSALAKGFDAPETAAQRASALKASRGGLADINYANARGSAKAVNLNGALRNIDDLLGRDPIMGDTALSKGELGRRIKGLRDQLQRKGEQLVDFDAVLNLKSDLYEQMQSNPKLKQYFQPVYKQLDAALERASPQYRAANDAFRAQSKVIDAVDEGAAATSTRQRATDTIDQFSAKPRGEQAGFRAGYADKLISKVEGNPGELTDRSRPLLSPKMQAEIPALAVPRRAKGLTDAIKREATMSETAATALGGSKTADNLADIMDVAGVDPTMLGAFAQGGLKGAALQGLTKAVNSLGGRNQQTRDMLADMLMETSPGNAAAGLAKALRAGKKLTQTQVYMVQGLISGSVPMMAGAK